MSNEKEEYGSHFNYAKNVPSPPTEASLVNIFSVVTSTRDAMSYAKGVLVDGIDCRNKDMSMGNSFFVQSGKCDEKNSVDECKGKDRWMYIDNIPKPYPACVDPTQPIDPQCSKNQTTGLIPGMLTDIAQMNPMEFLASSSGKGSFVNDKCVLRTESVGWKRGNQQSFYKVTKCAPEKKPLICNIIDGFQDYKEPTKKVTNTFDGVKLQNILLTAIVCLLIYKTVSINNKI